MVRRVLRERIRAFWPDVSGLRVMGCGYASPYLRPFLEEADRVFAVMSAEQGAHHWPSNALKSEYNASRPEKNLVCLARETALPFETASIDRVLLVHDLEFCQRASDNLSEIWRALKANGRLLVIVPNRMGLWARADWSPFGHGTPCSAAQIHACLRDNRFVRERTEEALFLPPVKFSLFLQSAGLFEKIGRNFLPFGAGVHMVEASKQVYARADGGSGLKVAETVRALIPRPAAQGG